MSRGDVQKESRPITIVLLRRAKACRQLRAGTPDRPHLAPTGRFAKGNLGAGHNEKPRGFRAAGLSVYRECQCACVPKRLGMSILTPGPMVEEIATLLM